MNTEVSLKSVDAILMTCSKQKFGSSCIFDKFFAKDYKELTTMVFASQSLISRVVLGLASTRSVTAANRNIF